MQVQQIANEIFERAGFKKAKFELKNQFHYPSGVSSLIAQAGRAGIQVVDDRPTAFYFKAKPYTFTNDSYIYAADHLSDLLSKKCLESQPLSDGSTLYIFQLN
jgi:hypothetical protein